MEPLPDRPAVASADDRSQSGRQRVPRVGAPGGRRRVTEAGRGAGTLSPQAVGWGSGRGRRRREQQGGRGEMIRGRLSSRRWPSRAWSRPATTVAAEAALARRRAARDLRRRRPRPSTSGVTTPADLPTTTARPADHRRADRPSRSRQHPPQRRRHSPWRPPHKGRRPAARCEPRVRPARRRRRPAGDLRRHRRRQPDRRHLALRRRRRHPPAHSHRTRRRRRRILLLRPRCGGRRSAQVDLAVGRRPARHRGGDPGRDRRWRRPPAGRGLRLRHQHGMPGAFAFDQGNRSSTWSAATGDLSGLRCVSDGVTGHLEGSPPGRRAATPSPPAAWSSAGRDGRGSCP